MYKKKPIFIWIFYAQWLYTYSLLKIIFSITWNKVNIPFYVILFLQINKAIIETVQHVYILV